MRIVLAFLVAPASFGLLLFGLSVFMSSVAEGIPVFKIAVMVAYPLAIIFGVPAYLALSKAGANGFGAYALTSLVFTTLLVAYFIIRPTYLENGGDLSTLFSVARASQMMILAFASFLTVSVFWLIARPDRLLG